MKKVILISAISIVALFNSAKAQTVSAQGKTIKLTVKQVDYLKSLNNHAINVALQSCMTIRYNSTADIILAVLAKREKQARQYPIYYTQQ